MGYCPQSFSGGGLYLNVNWLLWSVYDGLLWSVKNGLLWYMGHTSNWQFHTQWWHFSRQMVTIDYDGFSTKLTVILMIELGIWQSVTYRSQILQLTWQSVGGTNPSREVIFSSQAPGTFNMLRSPILAYFFGLTQMSVQTFTLPKPLQVNSVESKRADLAPPPVCLFAQSTHFQLYLCRNLGRICELPGFHIFQESVHAIWTIRVWSWRKQFFIQRRD